MIHSFPWESVPRVARAYVVIRRTVWQVTDPFNILLYVQKGECQLETGGQSYTLREGDLFFLPEKTMYIRRPLNDGLCTLFYTHFKMPGMEFLQEAQARQQALEWKQQLDDALLGDQYTGLLPGKIYLSSLMHLQPRREEIEHIIRSCVTEGETQELLHGMHTAALIAQLMLFASETVIRDLLEGNTLLSPDRTPEKLRQAVLFIRHHESEKISLTDLCGACAVSKQQMIRYFKTFLHMTPTEYITRYKINKATELFMRGPDLSIKEISSELGFEDQCYFSRVFTRLMGEAPTAFRSRKLAFDEKQHIAEAQQDNGE